VDFVGSYSLVQILIDAMILLVGEAPSPDPKLVLIRGEIHVSSLVDRVKHASSIDLIKTAGGVEA
jgi:hypothetical protein